MGMVKCTGPRRPLQRQRSRAGNKNLGILRTLSTMKEPLVRLRRGHMDLSQSPCWPPSPSRAYQRSQLWRARRLGMQTLVKPGIALAKPGVVYRQTPGSSVRRLQASAMCTAALLVARIIIEDPLVRHDVKAKDEQTKNVANAFELERLYRLDDFRLTRPIIPPWFVSKRKKLLHQREHWRGVFLISLVPVNRVFKHR